MKELIKEHIKELIKGLKQWGRYEKNTIYDWYRKWYNRDF